jgi:hypothetical protein
VVTSKEAKVMTSKWRVVHVVEGEIERMKGEIIDRILCSADSAMIRAAEKALQKLTRRDLELLEDVLALRRLPLSENFPHAECFAASADCGIPSTGRINVSTVSCRLVSGRKTDSLAPVPEGPGPG